MIRDSEEFRKKATMYKRWEKKYKDYCQMIKDLEYEESKIPSTFPETVLVGKKHVAVPIAHGDPKQKQIRRLEQIEHKEQLEKARDDYKKKMEEMDDALIRLPVPLRKLMIEIYIEKKKTIQKAAKELGYSSSGLSNRIYRALDRYLKSG